MQELCVGASETAGRRWYLQTGRTSGVDSDAVPMPTPERQPRHDHEPDHR